MRRPRRALTARAASDPRPRGDARHRGPGPRRAARSAALERHRADDAVAGRCARGPRRTCRIPEGLRLSSRAGRILARAMRPGRSSSTEAAAPELLAVLRFLRESPGSEALGISYGAAYLKAVPPRALTAEPFDAIAQMAERLADQASGSWLLASPTSPRTWKSWSSSAFTCAASSATVACESATTASCFVAF